MKLIAALGLLLSLASHVGAITCPSGSAFELRRPSDNVPLACVTGSSGNGRFSVSSETINGLDYNWPQTRGAAGTKLQEDGAGNLSFVAGGGGHSLATGTSSGATSQFTQRSTMTFNSAQFSLSDSSSRDETFVSLLAGPSLPPTNQVFLSGSGTYTAPSGVAQIRVRMAAAGGGGAAGGNGTGTGATGGTTSFGSFTVIGGSGGVGANGTNGKQGGAGGTGGAGTCKLRIDGGNGGVANGSSRAGRGGTNPFGGAGDGSNVFQTAGTVGKANTGAGGGGSFSANGGSGGGAGEYCELEVTAPNISATYAYAVGAGGAGGTDSVTGAAGGSGVIIVDEFYAAQGMSVPASSSTFINSTAYNITESVNGVCVTGSTITITASGNAPLLVEFEGTGLVGQVGSSLCASYLIDGQYPPGVGTNCLMHRVTADISSRENTSFSHQQAAPSAGVHSLCATVSRSGSSTSTFYPIEFRATELRNSAGTGDVASNGNNTLTGTNQFNGVTKIGSVGTDLNAAWTTFSPTWTGCSVNPTGVFKYMKIGRMVRVNVDIATGCTSNSTSFRMSLPVTASGGGSGNRYNLMFVQDNGTNALGAVYIPNDTTEAYFYVGVALASWTASGTKAIFGDYVYEAAQ
jgi:hypothetical protein